MKPQSLFIAAIASFAIGFLLSSCSDEEESSSQSLLYGKWIYETSDYKEILLFTDWGKCTHDCKILQSNGKKTGCGTAGNYTYNENSGVLIMNWDYSLIENELTHSTYRVVSIDESVMVIDDFNNNIRFYYKQ